MRLKHVLLAGLGLAAAAVAQPPSTPPSSQSGLGDLQQTVQGLRDQPAPARTPAAPATTPAPAGPAPSPGAASSFILPAQNTVFSAADRAALSRAVARGRQLIALGRAGILATQDMLSQVTNPEGAGIDGWIVEPQGEVMQVIFFDDRPDGPVTVYRANVQGTRVASRDNFPNTLKPPLSRSQARLARALMAVRGLNHTACSPAGFNYLVVPPQGEDGLIDVYEISVPSQRGRFPAGGHFRTSVRPNGQVAGSHAFASACADFEVVAPPAGEAPPPVAVAAGADPLPTEMHIFLSQMSQRALTFTAGSPAREWLIAGSRVAEVRDGTPAFLPPQN